MQTKVIGACVAGVVLGAGVTGGGLAVAGPRTGAPAKQVTVKLEWVSVTSSGSKISDQLAIVADSSSMATSSDSSTHEGSSYNRHAVIRPLLNSDGTVTLEIQADTVVAGKLNTSEVISTTVTLKLDETKVVKGFSEKNAKENKETLLFITPSAG